jgi:hypothetical protein
MLAEKFLLVLIEGQTKCHTCADMGAKTPSTPAEMGPSELCKLPLAVAKGVALGLLNFACTPYSPNYLDSTQNKYLGIPPSPSTMLCLATQKAGFPKRARNPLAPAEFVVSVKELVSTVIHTF